jgi:type II secretory pathway pseudopilin PulG
LSAEEIVMTSGSWLKIAAVLIAAVVGVSVYFAWRGTQQEQAQLKAALQAAQKALEDADARQQSRNSELGQLLAQLNEKKTTVQNPAQIVKALPDVLPVPTPLSLPTEAAGAGLPAVPGGTKQTVGPPNPKVQLPAEDLKPLYDFAVNCRECQAQLATAQANLKDEQTKTQALSRERDAALQAARGGSVLRRVVRAAKWFVIGAAAGAVAARLAR